MNNPVIPQGMWRRRNASAPWPGLLRFYVTVHLIWIAMYITLGKGFAYAGYQPLFVGELLAVVGTGVMAFSGRILDLARTKIGVVMTGFIVWQAWCTFPFLAEYQVDTLRDGVLWEYAIFAWITASMILRLPGLIDSLVSSYAGFLRSYVFVGPAMWLASVFLQQDLPHWPGTSVSIPSIKAGEYCVHMAGAFAFINVGIRRMSRWWLIAVFGLAFLGMNGRGGLLAFLSACGFILFIRPSWKHLFLIAGSFALLILGMMAFEIRIATPKESRELSVDQLYHSVTSAVAGSDNTLLEGTRTWRLAWWSKIWDYTVNGEFFWTGKGYGINLADDDEFQVGTRDEPLRSPHSSHVTFLARSGVPGFLLWLTLQTTWAGSLLISHLRARRRAEHNWAMLFAWILAYWVAFTVSAAFDVFLEGPMAGIPFWSLIGFGWGAHYLFQMRIRLEREMCISTSGVTV